MTKFPLHQTIIEDIADRELSDWVSRCVAECRRRALLNKVYDQNAKTIVNNIAKNVSTIEAHAASKTPVLDLIRTKHNKN